MSFSSTFQHKVSLQVCKKKMSFINYQIITSELSAVIILFYLLSAISNPNLPLNSISVFFFLIQRQLTEKLMRHTFFSITYFDSLIWGRGDEKV